MKKFLAALAARWDRAMSWVNVRLGGKPTYKPAPAAGTVFQDFQPAQRVAKPKPPLPKATKSQVRRLKQALAKAKKAPKK